MPDIERPRIVHIVRQFWPSTGGLEEYVDRLARQQIANGCRVFVLTLDRVFGRTGRLRKIERRHGLTIIRLPFVGYHRFFVPLLPLKLLRRFDLIHVHGVDQCGDVVSLYSFLGAPPFVCTSHGLFFHTKAFLLAKRLYFYTISRLALSRAHFVFSVSKNDQTQLAKINIKSTLIRNPVLPFAWMYSGGKDFLYVGRLAENKDVDKLIPFLARLRSAGTAHKLHIIGTGDEKIRQQLTCTIRAHNLESSVTLHGYLTRAQLQAVIPQCGYAVSAARYEGYGMAIAEAMSAGLLPVVQSNEAFREICRNSNCGLLVDFDDASAAASAFLSWEHGRHNHTEERQRARAYALSTSFSQLASEIGMYYRHSLDRSLNRSPQRPQPLRKFNGADKPVEIRRILGTDVVACRKQEAISILARRLADRLPTSVGFANANFLLQLSTSPARQETLNDMIVFNDGLGTDIASYFLYGKRFRENLNGTDFTPDFLARLPVNTRVFLYGARPDVVTRAAKVISSHFDVVVCGRHDGYTPGNEDDIVDEINTAGPDIVLVALGNPQQETWIARHRRDINAPLLMGVGAMFDFISGAVPRAPHWIRRLRLEWLYRLRHEPRRLFRRYTMDVVRFFGLLLAQRLGWRSV